MKIDRFKRGQIWWYENQGEYEEGIYFTSKCRPVIIVSNDSANRYSNSILVVPCTTADKKNIPTHLELNIMENSTVLCENIMNIHVSRLKDYLGTCDKEIMDKIENCIRIALGLQNSNGIELNIEYNKPIEEIKQFDEIMNKEEDEVEVEPIKVKKPRLSKEDKIRFLSDYKNHNTNYMLKKYNIKDTRALYSKVYNIRKELGENAV